MSGASLRPFHNSGSLVGRALTIRTRAGDNSFVHKAIDSIRQHDVLVIDAGGDQSRAIVGEILITLAKSKGASGFVVDGAVRDSDAIRAINFPCFARSVNHRGPYKNGPGAINVTVSIDGMIVEPGDIVVGDSDGVVAFSMNRASSLLEACHAQQERETEILRSISEGRYRGAYGPSSAQ
jgi:regulator of RNase E activity RraA